MTMAGYRHHNVYLLDLDLRKPGVAPDLGLPDDFVGLEDYLAGKSPINQVLWDIGIEGLTVAPSCNSVRDSSELITSGGMGSLLSTILSSVTNPVIYQRRDGKPVINNTVICNESGHHSAPPADSKRGRCTRRSTQR
jgi:hypothetical protein